MRQRTFVICPAALFNRGAHKLTDESGPVIEVYVRVIIIIKWQSTFLRRLGELRFCQLATETKGEIGGVGEIPVSVLVIVP
jgi:hypothetical protein